MKKCIVFSVASRIRAIVVVFREWHFLEQFKPALSHLTCYMRLLLGSARKYLHCEFLQKIHSLQLSDIL